MNHPLKRFGQLLLLAAVPAAIFTSCGDDDPDPVTPKPDQGNIQAIHVAPYNKVKVDLVVDDKKVADADFAKSTGYQAVNTGNRVVKVKANATQADILSLTQTIEKDKRYSVYVYNPTASTVGSLVLNDDQAAPAASKANVRFVNLGFDAGPITLQPQGAGVQPIATAIAYGQSSPSYVSVDARAYTLEARQATTLGSTLTSKAVTFEAGKIYTVVLRGRNSPAVPADEAITLDVINNN
ncbi:DUF4397 domain-containing protein [Hymenobacter busanensis]|uniref:DUF4397 domain-containing protein n=1 Tax=Hymenobacter busanensis TaxID=2607656 RepID=A0A7L5A459_9BACT|nr:DUF4397 domain-containing protein [Hymenobacter busanensis]KAA9338699.1 DUF4397 domain-containing protein [Hymenobacter busanensis]QHJ08870.1 DUF4397 domain-containing protein [Hymenobacter busanensis]